MDSKESWIDYSNLILKLSKLDDELKKYKNPIIIGEKNKSINIYKSSNYINLVSNIKEIINLLSTKYNSFTDTFLQKYIDSITKEINLSNKTGGKSHKHLTKKYKKNNNKHTQKKRI